MKMPELEARAFCFAFLMDLTGFSGRRPVRHVRHDDGDGVGCYPSLLQHRLRAGEPRRQPGQLAQQCHQRG